ncbi:MAG: ABC-F family ATP-binding cassette domain-containing protein [Verrucomicrobiales bacterium]|nr:ABC-F family ATP-binding cassette domain-containing protein [Verrucomicrobiales bacterium]
MAESIISATDICLSYGHDDLLDNASLAINEGDKAGLVGRNGCGKSSFLRILAGEENVDGGLIARRQGLVIGYLPQEFQLDDALSVEENIRSGAAELIEAIGKFESGEEIAPAEQERLQLLIDHADGWNLETRIETLMRKLDTPPAGKVVKHLSGGEKRRVGLARALVAQPDLLILDEPTNHLDAEAIEWLEGYLASLPGACLFVTHDRYFLDRIANRVIELSDGNFYSHDGNYSDYLISKEERQEAAQAAEHKRQRFLKREIEWVRAGVKARGTKQRSRLDNFYAVKGEKAPNQELNMELIVPPAPDLGNIVVNLSEISYFIEDRALFLGLDLEFKAGECVGIVGPNGAGKTTLLRIIMGQLEPTDGGVKIGKRTEFNYADQTRLELDEEKSIFEEVAEGKDMMRYGDETISVRGYLKRFLFSDERIKGKIGLLSGGEKNRVLLAKILKRGGNFLILDEPTNDLDLQSLRVLEEALINFTGTSLVVSHDRYFLDRVCDRVIVFEEPGVVTVNEGNYSYYREKRKSREASLSPTPAKASKKKKVAAPAKASAPPKLKWKEERELETMEETILEAEEALAAYEAKLADPQFFVDDPEKAAEMAANLEAEKAKVKALYDRWENLEAIRVAWDEWKADN